MEYVHLMGAEDVQRAGSSIREAAQQMQYAASQFNSDIERMIRALEEHAYRIEQAMEKKP